MLTGVETEASPLVKYAQLAMQNRRDLGGRSRRHACWLFLSVLTLLLNACCNPAPRGEKFFWPDEGPRQALRGFVYGVEAGQWNYSYSLLDERSRSEYESFELELAVLILEDPVSGLSVYDIITNALSRRGKIEESDRRATIQVVSKSPNPNNPNNSIRRRLRVFFTKEGDEWRLDLVGTFEYLQGLRSPGDADENKPRGKDVNAEVSRR